jgi:hypothetical protein
MVISQTFASYARISLIRRTPCSGSSHGCGGRCWRPRIPCTCSFGGYARIFALRHTPCTGSWHGCGGRCWRPRTLSPWSARLVEAFLTKWPTPAGFILCKGPRVSGRASLCVSCEMRRDFRVSVLVFWVGKSFWRDRFATLIESCLSLSFFSQPYKEAVESKQPENEGLNKREPGTNQKWVRQITPERILGFRFWNQVLESALDCAAQRSYVGQIIKQEILF